MKFLRYGPPGQEKPGVLGTDGAIRDLSRLIPDLSGSVLEDLSALTGLNVEILPPVPGDPRLGPPIA